MRGKQRHRKAFMRRTYRRFLGVEGAVLVEFALAAPILVTLVLGIADLGLLAANTAALEGVTRVGAEYARNNTTCQADLAGQSCIAGIKSAMTNSGNFNPPITFPSDPSASCECDDGSPITCGTTCADVGKPSPNRVLITVSASQSYTPILPWPGLPSSVTASTEMRVE